MKEKDETERKKKMRKCPFISMFVAPKKYDCESLADFMNNFQLMKNDERAYIKNVLAFPARDVYGNENEYDLELIDNTQTIGFGLQARLVRIEDYFPSGFLGYSNDVWKTRSYALWGIPLLLELRTRKLFEDQILFDVELAKNSTIPTKDLYIAKNSTHAPILNVELTVLHNEYRLTDFVHKGYLKLEK